MNIPQRGQRRRTAGWQMPPNSRYVGRPTKWGNRFPVGPGMTLEQSLANYRYWLEDNLSVGLLDLDELRGYDQLLCWCSLSKACHVDLILERMRRPMTIRCGNDITGAIYSGCKRYRYQLWRRWDASLPACAFLMLNPSTATETYDDRTIRRCKGYAKAWGFGGLYIANLFAYRATDPDEMKAQDDPIGVVNDIWIDRTTAACELTVCAWGVHGTHRRRSTTVMQELLGARELWALDVTTYGHPKHPLYLAKTMVPRLISFNESGIITSIGREFRRAHVAK